LESAAFQNIFCTRILDKFLLYAPPTARASQPLAALVNRSTVRALKAGGPVPESITTWLRAYEQRGDSPVEARSGPLTDPFFLGLIPTRGCNLACRYCNFDAPKQSSPRMPAALAREAVDAYIQLLMSARKQTLEVQFFGGEPFYAWDTVFFTVEYARLRAAELGLKTRFEVITNGVFSAERCRWVADHFDTVVLSLDGPPELHESQRPAVDRKPYTHIVLENTRILSDGPCELSLRACITRRSQERMVEIAEYFASTLAPVSVCFEMLVPSPASESAGLHPPDPYAFTLGYMSASRALSGCGIETVISTVNLNACQGSFCPVGKDALIISPDGAVDACYLLEEDWQKNGLDLHLGQLKESAFDFAPGAVQRARDLTARFKSACRDCLCQTHCAGGCHVRRGSSPNHLRSEVCIHTRLITIASILNSLGHPDLVDAWMSDRSALQETALSTSDRLAHLEAA